jgi:hypothetical protein
LCAASPKTGPSHPAWGVNTARIDTYAFALGSGIAGLAGCALSQVGNVGPDLGQGYIVDAFMVVVLGGVGQLAGTVYAALGLGMLNKFLEGLGRCGAGQDCGAGVHHHLYTKTSAGHLCHEGPLGGGVNMNTSNSTHAAISLPTPSAPLLSRTGWTAFLAALIVVCALAPVLNLLVPAEQHVSPERLRCGPGWPHHVLRHLRAWPWT